MRNSRGKAPQGPVPRTREIVAGGLAALLLAVGVSACGTSGTASGTPQTPSSSSQQSSESSKRSLKSTDDAKPKKSTQSLPLGSSTGKQSGTDQGSSKSSSALCQASELTARLTAGSGGGAGSIYPYLVLTNKGNRTCQEKGFPGVSLQAGGRQIGAAANRDRTVAPKLLTLKPGQSAYSELAIVNADNFDASACTPVQADSMVVYPPDQRESLRISTKDYKGCSASATTILTVRALQAGTGED